MTHLFELIDPGCAPLLKKDTHVTFFKWLQLGNFSRGDFWSDSCAMESNFIIWLPRRSETQQEVAQMLRQGADVTKNAASNDDVTKQNGGAHSDVTRVDGVRLEEKGPPGKPSGKPPGKPLEGAGGKDFVPGYKLKGLVYGVDDRPPLQIALVCAFQVSYCQGQFRISRSVYRVSEPPGFGHRAV